MGFLRELSHFINAINPQMDIDQAWLNETIEKKLCPLNELDERVRELAKQICQHPEERNSDVLKLIEKLSTFSKSPNRPLNELFKQLYPQFVPIKLDQAMESIKQKQAIDITRQEIKDLLSLKDLLPPNQLAILAHIFSGLAEQAHANKGLFDLSDATLQQLKGTQVATFSELQPEVEALQQKSYLSQEDRKAIVFILLSIGAKNDAFDKILEGSPTARSDYQAFKELLYEALPFCLTIQGKVWTPSMVKTLINTQTTLEELQEELGKKFVVECEDHASLELEPHQKYLLMEHSSIFYSLWTIGMQESLEGKVTLENISKTAFSRILADLNQDPYLPSDEVTLLEAVLFCKEWELAPLADKYEEELCILAKESSIEAILELNSRAFGLKKLEELCQEKISSYLREAVNNSKPQVFQDALNLLSPYAQGIDTLNLSLCDLSVDHLKQIVEVFPHLTSLNSSYCPKVTDAGLKELSTLKNLTSLDLSGCNITDAGLKELSTLKNLTSLDLSGCNITDAILKELSNFKNLTSLDFSSCEVTGAVIKELSSFKNLTSLILFGCQITDAGLKELSNLKNLTSLDLSNCQEIRDAVLITDTVLKGLSNLKNLTSLSLYMGIRVTDAGLKELSNLKNLTSLNLIGCKNITDAAIQEFQTLQPQVKIKRRSK